MCINAADIQHDTPLHHSLKGGLDDISYNEDVIFHEYRRKVLPLDGFLFWVKTYVSRTVSGSLHVSTHSQSTEIENYDLSQLVFSTTENIHTFHSTQADRVWVGHVGPIRFLIGAQKNTFKEAGLFHYSAETIPPSHRPQFIETEAELDGYTPVVGTSLPLFLSLPTDTTPALNWCPWPKDVPVFPSFSAPDNQEPPYIIVHNDPHKVQSAGMGAVDPLTGDTHQILQEHVRLTLVGLPHTQAANVRDYILHWALLHSDVLGIVNTPVLTDEKRALNEASALAMIKTLELDVMYSQNTVRHTALKLINTAKVTMRHAARQRPSV